MKSKTIRIIAAAALFTTLVACGEDLLGTVFNPSIASLAPTAGSVGSTISIFGTFLSNDSHVPYTVTFNGVTASATYVNDTEISVVVPSGATTGPVVVTNPNNGSPLVSNSQTFTVN